jgi:hypothetical protein
MKALLALDDAAELVLISLLPLLHIHPTPDSSLAQLLEHLVKAKPALGLHREAVLRTPKIRNGVRHQGVIPSAEEARFAAGAIEKFTRSAVAEVTDLALEEVSPVALVADDKARLELTAAQTALMKGDYHTACVKATEGFALGSARFQRRLSGRYRLELERLGAEPARLNRFGVPTDQLARFAHVTPVVHVAADHETTRVSLGREGEPTREEAAFALDFAVESLFRLEAWLAKNLRHLAGNEL